MVCVTLERETGVDIVNKKIYDIHFTYRLALKICSGPYTNVIVRNGMHPFQKGIYHLCTAYKFLIKYYNLHLKGLTSPFQLPLSLRLKKFRCAVLVGNISNFLTGRCRSDMEFIFK